MAAISQPEDARSQAERAYHALRREILHGALMPGERLRAAELQDKFGLGLTPIREALMRLSVEGMITGESHRGSWVRGASRAELADVMGTRRDIERACLGHAIARGDAAWEASIVAAYHLLSRTPLPNAADEGAAALWERHHRAFHFALVQACGSEWLLRFWNMLVDHSERYRKIRLIHIKVENVPPLAVERDHAGLMDAVLARDPDLAASLMDAHLARTEASVARVLDEIAALNPEDNP